MTDENGTKPDLIQRYVDTIWNNQEMHRIGEFLTEDVRLDGLGGEPPLVGRDDVVTEIAKWLGLYRSVHMRVIQSVADSDRVAWQWEMVGTVADRRLLAAKERADPAPADELTMTGMTISTFRGGVIAEEVTQAGLVEYFAQIGYPPKPPAPDA